MTEGPILMFLVYTRRKQHTLDFVFHDLVRFCGHTVQREVSWSVASELESTSRRKISRVEFIQMLRINYWFLSQEQVEIVLGICCHPLECNKKQLVPGKMYICLMIIFKTCYVVL